MTRRVLPALIVAITMAIFAGAAGATTIHQTQHLADGSTLSFTLTTGSQFPAAGAGVDMGDFGPSSGSSHSGVLVAPTAAGAPDVSPAVSGSQTMSGKVTYTNPVGVTLWTYGEQVSWRFGSYTVQSIYGQWAGSLSTCCLWGYHGNTSLRTTPAGGPNFQAFAQGTFQICVVWACETKSPWITLQGNGNGNETGFSWGIG